MMVLQVSIMDPVDENSDLPDCTDTSDTREKATSQAIDKALMQCKLLIAFAVLLRLDHHRPHHPHCSEAEACHTRMN